MALATTIAKVSKMINSQSVEKEGYHLNVTSVPISQVDYLTKLGVLNICAYAYGEASERLGYGINPITTFETILLWTDGTDVIQQHMLKYEGKGKH